MSRDDLESLTWISREEGSATRVVADSALAELGIVPTRRLALPAWEAIKLAVRRGHGIAAFSRHALAEELEAGTLVVIPFVPWKVRKTISIVRIRDATLTPPAHQFLLMLRARWGQHFFLARFTGGQGSPDHAALDKQDGRPTEASGRPKTS